jgi:hypothetical protein
MQLNEMRLGGEAPPQQYPDYPGQDGGQGWRSIQTADGQVRKPESGFGTGSAYSYCEKRWIRIPVQLLKKRWIRIRVQFLKKRVDTDPRTLIEEKGDPVLD